VASFAVATFLLVLGVSNLTVAGQAWISHRVDYRRRARAIGLYETSWAIALLVGAPAIAVVINVVGWRGPFVVLAVAAVAAAAMVRWTVPPSVVAASLVPEPVVPAAGPPRPRVGITPTAWLVMVGSALTAMAGLSVFVVSGSWLDDEFGVSTGGIGLVAMVFGATELVASLGVASLADRLGKLRSTVAGLGTLVVGLSVMLAADDLWLGIIGVVVFLLGFEYGFVASLSLVSEAMPSARGATIAVSNGVGTIARAAAAVGSGWLYSRHGIAGTAALSACAAVGAASCLLVSRRGGTR
jgi:predicted MFS family arabinose efflux permease